MKLLAFAASNSKQSINKKLVTYASTLLDQVDVKIVDLNDFEMPIYSADREEENGIPDLAHAFYQEITQADALLISFAEHNGSYTAAYKNIYDWTSRINAKVFQGKSMVLLSTSPGARGAATVLSVAKTAIPHFGGNVLADVLVPSFYDNVDAETGEVTNVDIQNQLKSAVKMLMMT